MAVGKKSSAVTFLLRVVAGRYDPRDPMLGECITLPVLAGLALIWLERRGNRHIG